MASSDSNILATNLFSVKGLNAVITGGGSGLGAMMARALATNGANKVFIIGRRLESLQKVASSVPHGNIIPLEGDVTSKASLQSCVDQVRSQVPYLDVVVANSGVSGPSTPFLTKDQKPLPFEELHKNLWAPSMEDVTSSYNVNITGVFYTAVAFMPLLHAANEARPAPSDFPRPQIIATSSIGGFSRKAISNFSYAASKAATTHLMKLMCTMLVPYNIRCNVIAPGLYLSEMTEGMYKAQGRMDTHNVEGTFPNDVIPATRSGDDEDMAGVILWLCGRAGAYLNGSVVLTDGGRLSVMPSSY